MVCSCVFFNDTATTEIYTLSLHDALPIYSDPACSSSRTRSPIAACHRRCCVPSSSRPTYPCSGGDAGDPRPHSYAEDRKSTRLNSSHANISYAVFCLKKKKYSTSLDQTVQ